MSFDGLHLICDMHEKQTYYTMTLDILEKAMVR